MNRIFPILSISNRADWEEEHTPWRLITFKKQKIGEVNSLKIDEHFPHPPYLSLHFTAENARFERTLSTIFYHRRVHYCRVSDFDHIQVLLIWPLHYRYWQGVYPVSRIYLPRRKRVYNERSRRRWCIRAPGSVACHFDSPKTSNCSRKRFGELLAWRKK